MDQILVIIGASIYIALGLGHGILTLMDVSNPKYFTPVNDEIRVSMQGVPIRLNANTDLWKAWLGFNLSHSLGVILFGASVFTLAFFSEEVFFASDALQIATIAISSTYFILSKIFWFWGPALGTSVATLLFLIGCYLL